MRVKTLLVVATVVTIHNAVKASCISACDKVELNLSERVGLLTAILHQFVQSSRRWSDPRCPQCRRAGGPFSDPSGRNDRSEKTHRKIRCDKSLKKQS